MRTRHLVRRRRLYQNIPDLLSRKIALGPDGRTDGQTDRRTDRPLTRKSVRICTRRAEARRKKKKKQPKMTAKTKSLLPLDPL
jgi:hypothetical protein